MPIHKPYGLRLLPDQEFKQITYDVMQEVFKLHNTIGCLFNEDVYKRILVRTLTSAQAEVPVTLSFGNFRKVLLVDLIVSDGAVFEFKAAEGIHEKHRAQLIKLSLCS